MKTLKRLLIATLAVVLTISLVPASPARGATAGIKLVIDGFEVKTVVPPFVEGGTTFVPLRTATEFLGTEVSWNKEDCS